MGSSYVQFYNIIYHLIYPIQWSYLMYNDHISHTMGWSPLGWYGYMAGVSTKVTASNPWRIRIKELLPKSGQSFNCETFRDTDIPQILRLWSSKSMPRNSSKIPASWSGSRGVWSWCFEPLGQRSRHVTCHRERWPSVRTSPLLWSRSLRSSSLRPAPDVPDVPDVCRSDVPVPVTACDSLWQPTDADSIRPSPRARRIRRIRCIRQVWDKQLRKRANLILNVDGCIAVSQWELCSDYSGSHMFGLRRIWQHSCLWGLLHRYASILWSFFQRGGSVWLVICGVLQSSALSCCRQMIWWALDASTVSSFWAAPWVSSVTTSINSGRVESCFGWSYLIYL